MGFYTLGGAASSSDEPGGWGFPLHSAVGESDCSGYEDPVPVPPRVGSLGYEPVVRATHVRGYEEPVTHPYALGAYDQPLGSGYTQPLGSGGYAEVGGGYTEPIFLSESMDHAYQEPGYQGSRHQEPGGYGFPDASGGFYAIPVGPSPDTASSPGRASGYEQPSVATHDPSVLYAVPHQNRRGGNLEAAARSSEVDYILVLPPAGRSSNV
jgi:hypothetical protein